MPILHRLQLRRRLIPLIATVLVMATAISLGNWQTRRAHEKQALEALLATRQALPPLAPEALEALDPAQREYRRVQVRGHFLADWPLYLDNRPHDGHAGLYLLMPFEVAQSQRVLWVARGWLARDGAERTRVPVPRTPAGEVMLEGAAVHSLGHVLQLGQAPAPAPHAIVQNAELGALEQASGYRAWPFFLEQHDSAALAPDGLLRDWPRPSLGIETHRAYALQWYALALMALLFFIVTGWRRGSRSGSSHASDTHSS